MFEGLSQNGCDGGSSGDRSILSTHGRDHMMTCSLVGHHVDLLDAPGASGMERLGCLREPLGASWGSLGGLSALPGAWETPM